jgi:hypothetical protein
VDTVNPASADDQNLEELHALLDAKVQAAENASEEIGRPAEAWIKACRQELREYFGLAEHDLRAAPETRSTDTTVDGNQLHYVEVDHPDQLTIRALRMAPEGQSRGVIVLMHGWPGHPAEFFENTGSGASKTEGVESVVEPETDRRS